MSDIATQVVCDACGKAPAACRSFDGVQVSKVATGVAVQVGDRDVEFSMNMFAKEKVDLCPGCLQNVASIVAGKAGAELLGETAGRAVMVHAGSAGDPEENTRVGALIGERVDVHA